MIFPTFEEILAITQYQIDCYGGDFIPPHNLQYEHGLKWALSMMQFPLIDPDPYPSVELKAALLGERIISSHTFHDGNKRTGIHAIIFFLGINGYRVDWASEKEIEDVALKIALDCENRTFYLQTFAEWLKNKLVKAEPEELLKNSSP